MKMFLKKENKNYNKVWEPSKNLPEDEKQRLVENRKIKAGWWFLFSLAAVIKTIFSFLKFWNQWNRAPLVLCQILEKDKSFSDTISYF